MCALAPFLRRRAALRAAVGSQSVPFIQCSRAAPSAVPWARPRLGALVEQRKRKIMDKPFLTGHRFCCCRFTTLVQGYITYGNGEFDGQDSGHDFYGVRLSPHSWRMHREQPGRCIRARRTVPYAICHFLRLGWVGVRVRVQTGT